MLNLKEIKKSYSSADNVVNALNGVSISFRKSEFVAILGPSGCGKTTLLNIVGGLDKYTSGDLEINEVSTKTFKDRDWDSYRNSKIGFVFQSYNLIPHLSVLENVEIALSISGLKKKTRRELATKALIKVGLENQIKKMPNQLSGGQMQRVAIARAIANNPEIILADEPTGALDSVTSVQVMEILKEISKDKLVIMVTHNPVLAQQYATRTIQLSDGKVISDSNPFVNETSSLDEQIKSDNSKAIDTNTQLLTDKKSAHKKEDSAFHKSKKTSMSFLTALHSSFKNLWHKKGRTFMISFAGSIGIIGVALVLAISNGFSGYINKMQSDTLSGYPLSVSTITVDLSNMGNTGSDAEVEEFPNSDNLEIYDSIASIAGYSKYNYLSPDFIEYVNKFVEDDAKKTSNKALNDVRYGFSSPLNVITKKSNSYVQINTGITTSAIGGTETSAFYEGLSESFISSQYDCIFGSYAKSPTELMLVVDEQNRISKTTLDALGIEYSITDGKYNSISFENLVSTLNSEGKVFKLIMNDDYYVASDEKENNVPVSFSKKTNLEELYNNGNSVNLTISGVLRIKKDVPVQIYESGIVYQSSLTDLFNENAKNSEIVQMQKLNTTKFYFPYKMVIREMGIAQYFNTPQELIQFVKDSYNVTLTTDLAIQYSLQILGASEIPTSIQFYPTSFEGKDAVISYLEAWNQTDAGKNNIIKYSDATAFLSSTMGQMVNIISYVLIAFASISLIVSSIMIGIITYVSVIERTKEIGVLRSLGARKKDITRVFKAETFIIGFCAGALGVIISYILCPVINAIIFHFVGSSLTTNIASLNIFHGLALIVISMLLTLISGLIPARMASKKDPVVALRTE